MNDDRKQNFSSFDKLKDFLTVPQDQESILLKQEHVLPQRDAKGRSYATGRCKTSTARVWVRIGAGQFVVNGKPSVDQYFCNPSWCARIFEPFKILGVDQQYDVWCTVAGGGLVGQAKALRHGLSHALIKYNPMYRTKLKSARLLTRDPREVERKKIGLKKARRAPQFSKR